MAYFISWLLKSFGISVLVTGYYWLFLRNNRMHQYNRVFLLSGFLLSIVVPLLPAPLPGIADSGLLQIQVGHFDAAADRGIWILTGTGAISGVFITGLLIEIARLYKLRRISGYHRMDGYHFILTNHYQAPFTFLNNLFWRTDISTDDMHGKKIMQHEMVHIRQKHGYEILFSQLIVSIFWMNPFFRIMQQELRLVHEFIADEGSIPIGDTDSFARLLLRSHNEGRYLHTVNGFFQSSVSRRLLMISKTGSGRFLNFRKLSVLPLLLLSVLLFSASLPVTQVDGSQKQRDEKIAAERALMQSGKHPTALKNQ